MKLSKEISEWIKGQVRKAHKKGIVLGLSGGIDSALTAVLSKKAMREHVIGLILPCESHPKDKELALKVARKFNIRVKEIDLKNIYKKFCEIFPDASRLARANLKPRLRMAILYTFANTLDYLVAGTGNKSELTIGYFTKYGDGGCDILPIGGLLKTDVRKMAKELCIPPEIIKRPPTAGLWEGQTDEGEIGISYKELDSCLDAFEQGRSPKIDNRNLEKIKLMIRSSKHKRNKIPTFKKK